MVKDGSGWGAHVGLTAALLARDGFTGAPALTVERDDAAPFWSDLGTRWRIGEQYFKAYPVCRWAQPAIEAALQLQRAHDFAAEEVATLTIESFGEAVTLGSRCARPRTSDEAQYSLAFPVAAAVVFGRVGADEVDARGLGDVRVARLVGAITAVEDIEFSRRFPAERWARVRIALRDGRALVSRPAQARGERRESAFRSTNCAKSIAALPNPSWVGCARCASSARWMNSLRIQRVAGACRRAVAGRRLLSFT